MSLFRIFISLFACKYLSIYLSIILMFHNYMYNAEFLSPNWNLKMTVERSKRRSFLSLLFSTKCLSKNLLICSFKIALFVFCSLLKSKLVHTAKYFDSKPSVTYAIIPVLIEKKDSQSLRKPKTRNVCLIIQLPTFGHAFSLKKKRSTTQSKLF